MERSDSRPEPALDDAYDAIVIGSGMGGLSAAASLALSDRRVLVLEQHTQPGGCTQVFRRRGYEWDVGLHYVGSVQRPTSTLRRVFDHLSGGALEWAPMPGRYNRIVLGDRSYDYFAGAERFKDEMKTRFPRQREAIDRYVDLVFAASRAAGRFFLAKALPPGPADAMLDAVSPDFFRYADRTTLDVMRELTDDPELIAVLTGHFGDVSLPPWRSAFAIHAMLIRHYINGASYPVGGAGRLAETFGAVIRAAGGAIVTRAPVEAILVEDGPSGGVAQGVRALGRVLRAPAVISAIGAPGTAALLPPETALAAGMVERARRLPPALSCTSLNVGVRGSGGELGLHPANLWVHPGNDFRAAFDRFDADPSAPIPTHFITFPSLKDPTWDARYPGRATISACSYTPWSLWAPFAGSRWRRRPDDYSALKEQIADRVWEQVLRFAPQLAGRVEHRELSTPLTLNHFLRRERGEFMGLAVTPARFRQRWLRPHTPIRGLFLAGQDVNGPGVGGAMLGGVMAASAATGQDLMSRALGRAA